MKSEYGRKPFPFEECVDCSYRIGRVYATESPHCSQYIDDTLACGREFCKIEFPSRNSERDDEESPRAFPMITLLNVFCFGIGGRK
jgi:hypothetical protein